MSKLVCRAHTCCGARCRCSAGRGYRRWSSHGAACSEGKGGWRSWGDRRGKTMMRVTSHNSRGCKAHCEGELHMRRDCIDGPRRASAAELRSQADCSGPQMRESPLHARMGITGEPLPAMWHAVPQPPVVEFILYWCRMCSSRLQNVLPDWGCAMLCRRPLYAAVQGRQPAGQGCELHPPL